jgi:hypothetical protein
LGVLLLAGAGASCAAHGVRFAPAVQDTDLRGEADDLQAHVAVAWRGIQDQDGISELSFRVRVENPGRTPFTLLPAEFELLDGALTSFGVARIESLPVAVEAGQAATFDLAFPAQPGLSAFDLTALTLNSRFQAGRWNWRTSFQRAPDEPSPWSFGFGVSWFIH